MKTCFITEKPLAETFVFGSGPNALGVLVNLTQEAFAHFVIRAGKDEGHKKIMADLAEIIMRAKAVITEANENMDYDNKPRDPNLDIDLQLKASDLDGETASLLAKKAQSGIRILRQMRSEFHETGKLTS